ncbi:MAG: N-formylglutamate amidohydrolase [Parvularculales bacterium]
MPPSSTFETLPPIASAPFECTAGHKNAGAVVVCDHASNALPQGYGSLGLEPAEFANHIAYDVGAAHVARQVAEALECPAILCGFSRLFIDANRGLVDPTLIMELSDGRPVPGNQNLTADEIAMRIEDWYEPYHRAIDEEINRLSVEETTPVLFSVHSFTPIWRGKERPWHVGILWDKDDRMVTPLLEGLRSVSGLCVGDNKPYSGDLPGDTMYRHGTARGRAHVLVELRHDLIGDASGQSVWAERLADLLRPLLVQPEIRAICHYGSRHDRSWEAS